MNMSILWMDGGLCCSYNKEMSMLYLVSRLGGNYACIWKALNEIVKEDPDFVPTAVFDFGSGTGSTVWACRELWGKKIGEYLCVDTSLEMNNLAQLLLQEMLKWEVLPHPPYSPDIAPSNYYLFQSMQHGLDDQHFSNYKEVKKWIDEWIAAKEPVFFRDGIRQLPERWGKVVASDRQFNDLNF
ncbi:hypothetical protein LAZ67_1003769 [Cordylochernes scorpioides]|uniref:Methyltransferase domain-containing protein n=1 Tax=Cordylochernes scorpioides TaxID=51811 RepID=A0ABY6JXW8_9ARAC|nr:hypothetical protein LAZ67_1003769 [Cordylochernes scorpioides]